MAQATAHTPLWDPFTQLDLSIWNRIALYLHKRDLVALSEVSWAAYHVAHGIHAANLIDGNYWAGPSLASHRRAWHSIAFNIMLRGHEDLVWCACAMGSGRVATGAWDNAIKVWDSHLGDQLSHLEGHDAFVLGLTYLEDEDILVSCGQDKTVRVWDAKEYTLTHTLRGHVRTVNGVTALGSGVVASCGVDRLVFLWDAVKGTCLHSFQGHTDTIESVLSVDMCLDVYCVANTSALSGAWANVSPEQIRLMLTQKRKDITLPDFKFVTAGGDKVVRFWNTSPLKATVSASKEQVVEEPMWADSIDNVSAADGDSAGESESAGTGHKHADVREALLVQAATMPDQDPQAAPGSASAQTQQTQQIPPGALKHLVRECHVARPVLSVCLAASSCASHRADQALKERAGELVQVFLVCAQTDGYLTVIDCATGVITDKRQAHNINNMVEDVATLSDGITVASSGRDGTMKLWCLTHRGLLVQRAVLLQHFVAQRLVALPDSRLAITSYTNYIRLYVPKWQYNVQ
eukprot:m.14253 g.14253  ORF g.14253 m.14253 type:complete len:520 (-) comp6179_c0_seq1:2130-3689(-)